MNKACLVCTVLSLCTSSIFADEVFFKKLNYFYQEGDQRKEHDARMIFTEDRILITDEDKPERATYADIQLASIKKVVYEKSSHPRWKTAVFLTPFALFAKGKKHWLTIQYQKDEKIEDFVFIRMDKDNYQMIIATMEARTGKPVEKMLED